MKFPYDLLFRGLKAYSPDGVMLWMSFTQCCGNAVHLCLGLLDCRVRTEASQNGVPANRPTVQNIVLDQFRIDRIVHVHGNPQFGAPMKPLEARWHDSNHIEARAIQCDVFPDEAGIRTELSLPESVTDNGNGRGATDLILFRRESPSPPRRDPQQREILGRSQLAQETIRRTPSGQNEIFLLESGEVLE